MKRITLKFIPGVFLAVIFLLSSCTSAYKVTKSEGTMVAIDSTWDVNPDAEAVALLAPYKAKVDSIMYRVLEYTKGNKTEAARLLKIGLTTLYRKIEEYRI